MSDYDLAIKYLGHDRGRANVSVKIEADPEISFWIDLNLPEARWSRLPALVSDICVGWFIPILRRRGRTSARLHLSHAPNSDLARMWALLCGLKIEAIDSDQQTPPPPPLAANERRRSCVSWGGGKDSYASLDLLKKVAPDDDVILFELVTKKNTQQTLNAVDRRTKYSFDKVVPHYNLGTARVSSNVAAVTDLPNSSNYFALIPYLIEEHGIDQFCFSFEAMFFVDGKRGYRFAPSPTQTYDRSRTLSTKVVSAILSKIYGKKFYLFNANYQFTEFSSFTYVASHTERGLQDIMMCENGGAENKWCGRCTKCSQIVLYCLALDIPQREIDATKFLTESPWVENALAATEGPHSPWFKGLSFPGHIDSLRHVLHILEKKLNALDISDNARKNLLSLSKAYGSADISQEDGIFVKNLFAAWPNELAPQVFDYLSEHFPVYDSPPFSKMWANAVAYRDEEKQATDRAAQMILDLF